MSTYSELGPSPYRPNLVYELACEHLGQSLKASTFGLTIDVVDAVGGLNIAHMSMGAPVA